jgi:hypothetical protein
MKARASGQHEAGSADEAAAHRLAPGDRRAAHIGHAA